MDGQNAPRPIVALFTIPDVVTTVAGDIALLPWVPGINQIISKWTALVKTAPVGHTLTGSIKRYTRSTGAVLDTLATVTIADGAFTASGTFTPVTLLDTQALAFEVTAVGSGTPGSNLVVGVS
jgi:hypothetical protein